ncbi:BrxE family protein [Bradyrhizobium uaiense]|uniref:BrxE family protein n=1 Tax=Bradyrhizobium uaiense TaxID=2594946 RepID=A0A6P1BER4_9BRAD|nr:BrxE family protein [Bradyrhizobium uaiense]NEU96938.1 BrxE family protein [Bradyrhizobium uaiense]
MSAADTYNDIDLAWLMKLRTVVARLGEMDCARWWNSQGQLGRQGVTVLRRSFPRTHFFAQAKSVQMIAAARCAEIFNPPGSVNLWHLTDDLEDRLDSIWESWLDAASTWQPFFEHVAGMKSTDVLAALNDFDLVTDADIEAHAKIKKSSDGRSIPIPEKFEGRRRTVALLALSFSASVPGSLVVPYARKADA